MSALNPEERASLWLAMPDEISDTEARQIEAAVEKILQARETALRGLVEDASYAKGVKVVRAAKITALIEGEEY